MTRFQIELPDDLTKAIEEEVAAGRYPSVSEYVGSLIRDDLSRSENQQLEKLLRQRLEGGPSAPMEDADFDAIRARLEKHLAKRANP